MEEIKIINKEVKIEEKIEEKIPEKSMKEMVNEIHSALENKKTRKIRLPRKARAKKRKLKKGWVGALIIDENRNIHGEKVKIEGSCFNEKNGLYHTADGKDIFWFDGKFPIIMQPSWRRSPIRLGTDELSEENNTKSQTYIKARMLADVIKVKSKGGSMIIWIALIGAAIFGINYFFGGGAA